MTYDLKSIIIFIKFPTVLSNGFSVISATERNMKLNLLLIFGTIISLKIIHAITQVARWWLLTAETIVQLPVISSEIRVE